MHVISSLYRRLSRRRGLLFFVTAAAVFFSAAALFFVEKGENIDSMLPDDSSETARDFRLLGLSPFAGKIVIDITAGPGVEIGTALETADRLAASLSPPLVTRVIAPPDESSALGAMDAMMESIPLLADRGELKEWMEGLSSGEIRQRLREVAERLQSPEGLVMKKYLVSDPLGLAGRFLGGLAAASPVRGVSVEGGHFVSADGRSVMLAAETPIAITDSAGSRRLEDYLLQSIKEASLHGVTVSYVSGHRYTLANADVIRRDMWVVLALSTAGILTICVFFMRSWSALLVLIVPLAVLSLATVGTAVVHGSVSAITIGFGAVLLGISVDYAIHVWFALRRGGGTPEATIGSVATPVLLGGFTTLGAFALLLQSSLPGQRQLAVFSMTGIAAALFLSLVVLPHAVPSLLAGRAAANRNGNGKGKGRFMGRIPRTAVIGSWLLIMAVMAVFAARVSISGDLREVSVVPVELRAAEEKVSATWGNVRGRAIFFAAGSTLAEALERNGRLFEMLSGPPISESITSIAKMLPSPAAQQRNWEGWLGLWRGEEGRRIREEILSESEGAGFSRSAFAPYVDGLEKRPRDLTPDRFGTGVFRELLDSLIVDTDEGFLVLTLVDDSPEAAAVYKGAGTSGPGGPPEMEGITMVSPTMFSRGVSEAVEKDFSRFILLACLAVTLLLALIFRNVRHVCAALAPVGTGLVFMFGVMGMMGLSVNIFNIVATILIVGLGVDYGIFMVCRVTQNLEHDTERAVFVSALTTLAAFSALVAARHPSLSSVGLTVLLGIGASVPAALFLVPVILAGEDS